MDAARFDCSVNASTRHIHQARDRAWSATLRLESQDLFEPPWEWRAR